MGGGDKHAPGDDLYENVILWAAKQGMVGVNVNYRFADYRTGRNLCPVQEQDLSAAVDWIAVNIAAYGGDPNRMFLWGHSAGGSAVAGFASNPAFYGNDPIVKGIFLLSAPIDPMLDEQSGRGVPYYGKTAPGLHRPRGREDAALRSRFRCCLATAPRRRVLSPCRWTRPRRFSATPDIARRTVTTKGSHQGEMLAVGTVGYLGHRRVADVYRQPSPESLPHSTKRQRCHPERGRACFRRGRRGICCCACESKAKQIPRTASRAALTGGKTRTRDFARDDRPVSGFRFSL